jgi:hypothetical protein
LLRRGEAIGAAGDPLQRAIDRHPREPALGPGGIESIRRGRARQDDHLDLAVAQRPIGLVGLHDPRVNQRGGSKRRHHLGAA